MFCCPNCSAKLLRWSWWEHPSEIIWYWYCLECDKEGRSPFIFVRPRKILVVAGNHEQAQYWMRLYGINPSVWNYASSNASFLGLERIYIWMVGEWWKAQFYLGWDYASQHGCIFYYPEPI